MVALRETLWNEPITVQRGDVWQLGRHRLMVGDSTCVGDVARLMQGEKAVLCMADPPYGMGKEKDGVANDNLYDEKLDAFQMRWWQVARPHLTNNASAYIWGNAESLWRLWYSKLKDSERLTFRNEIVWDKEHGQGMLSEQHRMYPVTSERCFFFVLGEHEYRPYSSNAVTYWQGWEPLRSYLEQERLKMRWNNAAMKRAVGHSEKSGDHWTGKCQWELLSRPVYENLQLAAQGKAFTRSYDDLYEKYNSLRRVYDNLRPYFDNTHDLMTDVWSYPRVTGKERYGHPTPKPVAMIERIIKTSSPLDSLTYDPFLGSGTSIISAEKAGRRCYGLEINETYCETIIGRWQEATGQKAERVEVAP